MNEHGLFNAMKIYQVDAFTDKLFGGNSAAVCPLNQWLEEDLMQSIAAENNLAETAFYVKTGDRYHIRWFTPAIEVDLCGHATLAAAYVLFEQEGHDKESIEFESRSGILSVSRNGEWLTLNFPADFSLEVELTDNLLKCCNFNPVKAFRGKDDYMLVFQSEKEIQEMIPDFLEIEKLDSRGLLVTAKGDELDFVSRYFAPQSGINEDPVTGSAHTLLTPYWSEVLNKSELEAFQLSRRKGYLKCRNLGGRIEISGKARLYMKGSVLLEN